MTAETFKIEILPLKNRLYRFACRMLRDTHASEDVVQEVLIRLWMRREKLNQYRNIEAFAMTITKNLCLDKLKRAGANTVELNESHALFTEKNPHEEMEITDACRKVKKLIDQLPDQQRMIIHLRDVEGYDYDEIAGVTGLTENTIRVNLSRARKRIREIMFKMNSYEFTKN